MTEFNVAFRMHRDLFVVVDNAQRSKLLSRPKDRKAREHCLRRERGAFFALETHIPLSSGIALSARAVAARRGGAARASQSRLCRVTPRATATRGTMIKRNRVVITGIGILAPNGIGLEAFWESSSPAAAASGRSHSLMQTAIRVESRAKSKTLIPRIT